MQDKGMRKYIIFVFMAIFSLIPLFSQTGKALVIRVELYQEAHKKYSEYEKSYVNAAYRQFQQDLTKDPQIQIRTPETDNDLRSIQKESQIEASKGLASEDAAYATDKGSRAALSIRLQMAKVGKEYQLSCEIREIEKMSMTQRNTQKASLEQVSSDVVVDALAYEVLMFLQEKSYINRVSLDITNQLLHRDAANSEENLKKYLNSYAKQKREAEAELAALRAESKSKEDKLAKEARERALQLNIELAEKNRQIAEQNLRRQQEKKQEEIKRQDELKKISREQQEKFIREFEEIEAARRAIQKENLGKLSLKKRIELIESARDNLRQLENQLSDTTRQNRTEMTAKMQKELDAKENEPWRKADLSNGLPTSRARKFRDDEKAAIRKRYEAQIDSDEKKLRAFAEPGIAEYRAQVQSNIDDMQKTLYVFRSVNEIDDFLHLQVDEYDGDRQSWEVHSNFVLTIEKTDTSAVILPPVPITYRMMVGKEPDMDSAEGYKKYQDDVDKADFYFRTKVPYLYSELGVKVKYDDIRGLYVVQPQEYAIYRTQDNSKPIATYNAGKLAAVQKKYESEIREKQEAEEAERRAAVREIKMDMFWANQKARQGVYLDLGYAGKSSYHGFVGDLNFLWGGKHFFGGFDATLVGISDSCFDTKLYKSITYVSCEGLIGLSINLAVLRPYIAGGVGIYNMTKKSKSIKADTTSKTSFTLLGEVGVDLVLGKVVLGGVYKLRNYAGSGYLSNISVSLGYNW